MTGDNVTTTDHAAVRSAYVHVPFCQTICGYCDFYSVTIDKQSLHPLVDALIAEFQRQCAVQPVSLETIFVGGGTPTTLPTEELRRLLVALTARRDPAASLEFTVEANPATVSRETAETLVAAGVTRVSIGAQSFDASELRVLERIHHPPQVAQTVRMCRDAGVREINLDLIFGVPGQTLESWSRNLEQALSMGPDHLSCYALTYERGTPLFEQRESGRVKPVEEELEASMYEHTMDRLAAAGYEQYEISNFARPGRECRHNLAYWLDQPYLGVGPSACGFVAGVRYRNIPDHREYARAVADGRSPRISEERLEPDRRARETAMLALRLNRGIERTAFARRYGVDAARLFADAIEKHRALGLIALSAERIALTRAGRLVASAVTADFI